MKKLSVLLVAAAVAISASAGVQHKLSRSLNTNKMVNKEMVKVNDKQLETKANFRAITTQPEGELKSYNRSGQYMNITTTASSISDNRTVIAWISSMPRTVRFT